MPFQMFRQSANTVAQYNSTNCAEQHTILFGNLVNVPHKYASGLIKSFGLETGIYKTDDRIHKTLAISHVGFTHDDQINSHSLISPICVRFKHLANEVEPRLVRHSKSHYGQIAGYTVCPKIGLTFAIACNQAAASAQTRVGIYDKAGQLTE